MGNGRRWHNKCNWKCSCCSALPFGGGVCWVGVKIRNRKDNSLFGAQDARLRVAHMEEAQERTSHRRHPRSVQKSTWRWYSFVVDHKTFHVPLMCGPNLVSPSAWCRLEKPSSTSEDTDFKRRDTTSLRGRQTSRRETELSCGSIVFAPSAVRGSCV